MPLKNYLDEIRDYTIREALPDAGRTALLVVDMQYYFRELAEPILKNVISLIDVCRKKGLKVIFTRHGHRDPQEDGGMLKEWWGELIEYGTRGWELMEELDAPQELILDKNRYSAFFNTDFEERLQRWGVQDLIITGVMTNYCCETTARDAFMRDYRVFFVADATATNDEELHVATLKNLAFGFAYIVDTRTLCQYLNCV